MLQRGSSRQTYLFLCSQTYLCFQHLPAQEIERYRPKREGMYRCYGLETTVPMNIMIRACCYIVAVWMGLSLSTARADRDVTGDIARVSDPCIIKADGKYYIFCSGPGVPIRESRDLIAWKQTGIVFPEMPAWAKEHVPGAKGFWAPDISFRDGVYYLYYAVSTLGSRRSVIGLATNTTLDSFRPEYHWQDRGLVIESHSRGAALAGLRLLLGWIEDGCPGAYYR